VTGAPGVRNVDREAGGRVLACPPSHLAIEFGAAPAETPCCGPGEILLDCAGGVFCAPPCNGIVGDHEPGVADPTCSVVAIDTVQNDESDAVCNPQFGNPNCAAGTLACVPDCFVPCDGDVGCVPNGRFGDEEPELCGLCE
jgi:hypothetical protein